MPPSNIILQIKDTLNISKELTIEVYSEQSLAMVNFNKPEQAVGG